MHASWLRRLENVADSTARRLKRQLDYGNLVGFDVARGGMRLGESALEVKRKHPCAVALIRRGDFYECYGVDAVMLVEHARCRPHAPKGQIQAVVSLNCKHVHSVLAQLVQAGLSIAVVEEVLSAETTPRTRFIAQLVSPSNPRYVYAEEGAIIPHDVPEAKPIVGVAVQDFGYLLCAMDLEARVVRTTTQLPLETLRSRIQLLDPALCLLSGLRRSDLPLSPVAQVDVLAPCADFTTKFVQHVERATAISTASLQHVAFPESTARPHPLHLATAQQLGVVPQEGIPSLIQAVLPTTAPVPCQRWLRQWLLEPPDLPRARSLRALCRALEAHAAALPSPPLSLRIVRALETIHAGRARAPLLSELREVLRACASLHAHAPDVFAPAFRIVEYQLRFQLDLPTLRGDVARTLEALAHILPPNGSPRVDRRSGAIPASFFEHHEAKVLHQLHPTRRLDEQRELQEAAAELERTVARDFFRGGAFHHAAHHAVWTKRRPTREECEMSGLDAIWLPARTKSGAEVRKAYTTHAVEEATRRYERAVEALDAAIQNEYRALCADLSEAPCTRACMCALQLAVVVETAVQHCRAARAARWGHVARDDARALALTGLVPYWLGSHEAVANDVELQDVAVLTSPNMSGKSTFVRALCAAALLGMSGLCVPAKTMDMPHYRLLFLRTACHDIPSQGISSYELEMLDVKTLLEASPPGHPSLVCTDELGRGTSSREGASFALALLEHLRERRFHGLMATHLHEIFDLPTRHPAPIRSLRMRVDEGARFTYQLEEGVCTYSMAHAVASKRGLPDTLLKRQLELEAVARAGVDQKRARTQQQQKDAIEIDAAWLERETGLTPISIAAHEQPPPCTSQRAHVYLLSTLLQERRWYYVGETDDLHQRIVTHRKQAERKHTVVYALTMPDKSRARQVETRLLHRLQKEGVPLLSEHDAQHHNFSRAEEDASPRMDLEQILQNHLC